jgi:hypothetical protein
MAFFRPHLPTGSCSAAATSCRAFCSSSSVLGARLKEPRFNFASPSSPFNPPEVPEETIARYPLRTADQLKSFREPPRNVRMLARDFIDDSLYNPYYGYFSTKVQIVETVELEEGLVFNEIKNIGQFENMVAERYGEGEGARWHTPTELFKVTIF